jgi:hypothetical protein
MSVPSHADVIVLKRDQAHRCCPGPGAAAPLLPIRSELAALLRTKQLRVVVSEFEGLERAPEALTTVFDRGSPYIGSRVVRHLT